MRDIEGETMAMAAEMVKVVTQFQPRGCIVLQLDAIHVDSWYRDSAQPHGFY